VFPGSSAVEQPAVNRLVAGSNPARGAKQIKYLANRKTGKLAAGTVGVPTIKRMGGDLGGGRSHCSGQWRDILLLADQTGSAVPV
jgi:hypothetical protein